jgi:two-component system, OmpR family, sensor histidine kinase TctE
VIEELNELLHNASHQIQAQRQFIANAAHQLRTPITALRTYADHAERLKDGPREELYPVLEQMTESTRRVSHLVNRLLSLARSEEPKQLLQVDLTQSVQEAAARVLHEAMRLNIELEFDMPEGPIYVKSDRGELVEMLTNLLENAISYNKKDGSVCVRVKPTTGERIELVVEDTGPGIPDEEKEKVFERFYRLPESRGPGCGLGLAIVAEISERNDIDVQIGDRDGGGCSVRLSFPRHL